MKNRICPFCGKEFSSGASYRVHKSRYHRGETAAEEQDYKYTMDNATTDEPQVVLEDAEPETVSVEDDESKEKSGPGWLLGLGGIAVAVILLFFFGRYGGGRR